MARQPKGSGRERLLDAAEALFAQRGFSGASVRDISRAAGVELGLSGYHFGSKDELFRSVMARRAAELCGALLQTLEQAEGEAPRGIPDVPAVLAAYIKPHVERLAGDQIGWRHYMKLGGHTAILEQRSDLTEPLWVRYAPVAARYSCALRAALPAREPEEVDTDFHIFRLTVATIAGEGGWRGDAGEEPPRTPAEICQALTRLFSTGFLRLG